TALETIVLFYTETRGAILGLLVGVAVSATLALIYMRGRGRTVAGATLGVLLVLVGGFYAMRHTSFVQNDVALTRVASIFSPGVLQVRFEIWHVAFEGFLERPVVGWGQEGFNYV